MVTNAKQRKVHNDFQLLNVLWKWRGTTDSDSDSDNDVVNLQLLNVLRKWRGTTNNNSDNNNDNNHDVVNLRIILAKQQMMSHQTMMDSNNH